MHGSGGLLNEYSLGVCNGQADNSLNINSVYAWVRQIVDRILCGWHCQIKQIPIGFCVDGIVIFSRYGSNIM